MMYEEAQNWHGAVLSYTCNPPEYKPRIRSPTSPKDEDVGIAREVSQRVKAERSSRSKNATTRPTVPSTSTTAAHRDPKSILESLLQVGKLTKGAQRCLLSQMEDNRAMPFALEAMHNPAPLLPNFGDPKSKRSRSGIRIPD